MRAGNYDPAVEDAASLSLLNEYVEAAYLLPVFADPQKQDSKHLKRLLDTESQMAGCLRFFHAAILPQHPLHTRLTSCACLIRVWAEDTTDCQADIVTSVCDCLQEGLEVTSFGPLLGGVTSYIDCKPVRY